MKKILFLLLALCALSLQAQTLLVSQESRSNADNKVVRVLCDEKKKAVYVLRGIIFRDILNYSIEKYNKETLELIYSTKNTKPNSWYIDMYMLNGRPYILLKEQDTKVAAFNYYLIGLDQNGDENYRLKIGSIEGEPKAELYWDTNGLPGFPQDKIVLTENKERPYVLMQISGGKEKSMIKLTFFGPDFIYIEDKIINIPVAETKITGVCCAINNNTGEVYTIIKLIDQNPTSNSQFYFHKMAKNGKFEELEIKIKDSELISDARFFYGEDKTPYIIGVSIYEGFFVEKLDSMDGIYEPDIYEFDEELTKKSSGSKRHCDIVSVFADSGKYVAVFKSYYIRTETRYISDFLPPYIKYLGTVTLCNNVTCFNNEGTEWSYDVAKLSQEGGAEFDRGAVIIYPNNGGYNLIARSEGAYHLIKIKGGNVDITKGLDVKSEFADNYYLLKGHNTTCYDNEGNCYIPWQINIEGGPIGKRETRLLKFVP